MTGTSVVWDLLARDQASKAFLGVAASADEMRAQVTKSFSEQSAVSKRAAASINASLKAQESEYLRAGEFAKKYGGTAAETQAKVAKEFNDQGAALQRSVARSQAALKAQEAEYLKAAEAAKKYGSSTAFLTSHKEQLDKVATGLAGVGAAAAIGFGAAVKEAMDFQAEMAKVGAFSDNARAHITQLTGLAKQFTPLGYSATQAAQAEEELVKAGVSAQDMINGGLKGALALAAAGQIDVSQATEIASAAMTEFGLKGKDIPHVADELAAGADKALGGVSDLGEALSYSGTQAHQYGVSLNDTVGVLAEFASQGQLGSVAGTEFAQVLARLGAPTAKAAGEMKAIGLNVYDANGNFVDMTTLAGRLQKSFDKLSPAAKNSAEQIIFGQRAIRGANILIQEGAKQTQDWINKTNDQGFAAQTASRKLDSLTGDLQKLKAAGSTGLIDAGTSSQAPLRQAVQEVTRWIDAWNKLSPAAETAITDIVRDLAVLGLGGAATIKILTGVAGMKTALVDLGITGRAAGAEIAVGAQTGQTAMVGLKGAVGAVAIAYAGLLASGQLNKLAANQTASVDQMTASLIALSKSSGSTSKDLDSLFHTSLWNANTLGPLTQADALLEGTRNKVSGLSEALDRTFNRGVGTKVTDWITGVEHGLGGASGTFQTLQSQFSQLDSSLTNLASSGSSGQAAAAFRKISAAADKDHVSTKQLLTLFPQYEASLQQQANALGVTNLSAQQYASWMGGKVPAAIRTAEAATKSNNGTMSTASAAASQLKTANAQLGTAYGQLTKDIKSAETNFTILNGGMLSAAQASDQYKDSLSSLTSAVKSNGSSLNDNTTKGRANREAIEQSISAMNDSVKAQFTNEVQTKGLSKATDDSAQSLKQQKKDLINQAAQAGLNRSAVKKMVDQMVLTPKQLKTEIRQSGAQDVENQIKQLQREIDALSGKKVDVSYSVTANGTPIKGLAASVPGGHNVASSRATGGPIVGPGTGTSDDVLLWGSNGEYMQRTAAVNYYGTGAMDAINQMRIPKEAISPFLHASGGLINTGGSVTAKPPVGFGFSMPAGSAAALGKMLSAASAGIDAAGVKAARNIIPSVSAAGGSGVARWAPLILQALAMLGQPASLLGDVEHRMAQESGGNPTIVNNWDSNAAAGHPSQGLMQTIPGTFAAYSGPLRSRGILDPLANIYAGLNYALHNYPSLAYAMMKSGGYANGTDNASRGWHLVGENGPEAMLFSGGEKVISNQAVQHLASGGPVKAAEFGSSSAYSVAQIVALLRAITNPQTDLKSLTAQLRGAQAASRAANRAIAHPTHVMDQADAAYNQARRQQTNLRARNAQQVKDARDLVAARKQDVAEAKKQLALAEKNNKAKKDDLAVTRAKHALAASESKYSNAEARASKISRDNTNEAAKASKKVAEAEALKKSATDAYNRVATVAKTKADALKTAQQNLATEQQAVADSAKQMAQSLTGFFTPQTTSAASLVKSMTEGAKDITQFTADIRKLRTMHLSETVIGQVIAEAQSAGVPTGDAFAKSIIAGGAKLVGQLNQSSQALTDASNIFGYRQALSTGGYASGTNWATPGIHDVAENAVEVVVGRQARRFKGGEQVLNGQQTAGLLQRPNVILNVNVSGNDIKDEDKIAKSIATRMGDQMRMYGLSMGALA